MPGNGLAQSFSTLTLNPLKALKNLVNYKDDIESLVVRKGCVLEVFQESDCTGSKYTFRAESDEDLIVEELDESDAEDFGKYQLFVCLFDLGFKLWLQYIFLL